MGSMLVGDWDRAVRLTRKMARNARSAADKAIRDEAFMFRLEVNKAFTKSGYTKKWPKLNMLTRQLRKNASKIGGLSSGGVKPLVRSGNLRASVNIDKRAPGEYFVGVSRKSGGKNAANVAAIHEQPNASGPDAVITIEVTQKMRRYFMYLFLAGAIRSPLRPGKTHIVIKRRSFLADVYERFSRNAGPRVLKRYHAYLMGKKRIQFMITR